MKKLALFLSLFCFLPLLSVDGGVPTPDLAMSFTPDSREWDLQSSNLDANRAIVEMVPKGDVLDNWKEMVEMQIGFVKAPVRDFVDLWKDGIKQFDPKVQMTEAKNADGSITVKYRSDKADEIGIRRFIPGSDGVYMLAYHVRVKIRTDSVYKEWEDIIAKAKLVPNPEKAAR